MENNLYESYLRELFEKTKEEQYKKELCGEIDSSYMELNIDALELMGELSESLSKSQLELFKKINLLNFQYLQECEFIAFKNGYEIATDKISQTLS